MWKTEIPITQPTRAVFDNGAIRGTVEEYKVHRWQHFLLSFGATSENGFEACKENWPREAIRLAREKLDQFEAHLDATDLIRSILED